ncbi:PP2C family protein-serine/threonine phosphatase [Colwellia ponticola]|uniref:Serine/threonine-protein phosphatase n=1 Tax=Colwellia ponticola TaxID=2304625 RepID=A0A8H2JN62_9GAMM|nr:protein phosphatase 2C domain-containing protein [Colwellia ponticola]TMM46838.1 serine/threonine-protein phosphatase [Colwellia ponticola]
MNHYIKSLSHQGVIRRNNEDAISYGSNESLGITWMIIADGMGGHNAGEVASAMLIKHFQTQFSLLSQTTIPNWQTWIKNQLNAANNAILLQAKTTVAQQGMGTTAVLMVIVENNCHLGWVGDSRAYTLQDNRLVQQSVDHTMIQALVTSGAISAETAKQANTKNLLSQAIGVKEAITVDTKTIVINSGDTIMLSTDGLHDYLTEAQISDYLAEFSSEKEVCKEMLEQAIAQNSRDNLTVGLVKCG